MAMNLSRGREPGPAPRRWLRTARWAVPAGLVAAAGLCAGSAHAADPAGVPAVPPAAQQQLEVLDRFVGSWRVTLQVRRPKPSVVTYTETYRWVLGHRFIRAEVDDRSDGIHSVAIGTYDPATRAYPFWIFQSTGAWFYLDGGRWDERARRMTWASSAGASVSYRSVCDFPQSDLRVCRTEALNWKGNVLSDFEFRAERIAR